MCLASAHWDCPHRLQHLKRDGAIGVHHVFPVLSGTLDSSCACTDKDLRGRGLEIWVVNVTDHHDRSINQVTDDRYSFRLYVYMCDRSGCYEGLNKMWHPIIPASFILLCKESYCVDQATGSFSYRNAGFHLVHVEREPTVGTDLTVQCTQTHLCISYWAGK